MDWKPMITQRDCEAIPKLIDADDVSTERVENETIGQIADRWRASQHYFGAGHDAREEAEVLESLNNPSGQ